MKNISFLSENFQYLEVKFCIYLNRRVFIMLCLVWYGVVWCSVVLVSTSYGLSNVLFVQFVVCFVHCVVLFFMLHVLGLP